MSEGVSWGGLVARLRIAAVAVFLVFACAASAAGLDVSLDGEWDFTYTAASASDIPEVPPSSAFDARMPVPGRWDDHIGSLKAEKWFPQAKFVATVGTVKYLSGVGWHRRTVDVPAGWVGRSVTLTVGWAPGNTYIWLNGQYVGRYDYGVYTPFSFDLTSRLKTGQANELLIAIDNTRGFAGGWNYFGAGGRASGLFRPVTLHVADGPGRISDLWIQPGANLKEVVWNAELEISAVPASGSASRIEWEVRSADNKTVLAEGQTSVPAFAGSHRLTWKHRVDRIKSWSDREPNLYRTRIRWVASGKIWDSVDQRFGLRRWSSQGRKLFLNGLPIYVRGDFGPTSFPLDVSTPTSRAYYKTYFTALKQAGMNEVNFSHKVPPPEMLEVADEMGVIVMGGDETTAFETNRDRYKEVWEPIVRATRKYPSMCMYGFGGEHDYYDGAIEQFQKQYDFIKSLYPECLIIPQQAIRGVDYAFDEEGARELTPEPFPHHAARLARYTKACDVFGHYSGGAFGYFMYDGAWQEMNDRFKIYDKPLVVHETYMRASHLNPANAAKYTGRQEPWMYTKLRQDLEKLGLLDRWPTYFANSSRLNAIARKYCQEKVRKPDELIGYELLGLGDMHFQASLYPCGITDEFMQLKPGETWDRLQRYMGENLVLLDWGKDSLTRSFYAGEAFQATPMVSLYGPRPFAGGKLEWALKEGQTTILTASRRLSSLPNGDVTSLESIRLTWPEVRKTTRLNLSLRVTGSGYDLSNDWDFWVFHRSAPPAVVADADEFSESLLSPRYATMRRLGQGSPGSLRIVGKLGEEDIGFLEQGGDVVLLGTKPFASVGPIPTYPGHSGSAAGNVGAIINPHPIFRDLPDEGWGDWQFMPLLRPAACVRLDDVDTEFDPILEIISSPTEPRKQAALFEKRVGKGRLLVSTCTIDLANPSCTAYMDGVLAYVSSDGFRPRSDLSIESLRELLAPPPARDPANLLPFGDFEKPQEVAAAMDSVGAYEVDKTIAHGGKRSLKLLPNSFVDAGATVSFAKPPRALKLSAWCRADGLEGESGKDFQIYVYLICGDGCTERLALPLDTGTHDWRYAEVSYTPTKEATGARFHIGYSKALQGTAWLDGIFFGEDLRSTGARAEPREWHNKTTVIDFGRTIYARVDQGEWGQQAAVTLSREGLHKVYTSESQDHAGQIVREIGIDLTPPSVEVLTDPLLTQLGGVYYATPQTLFTVVATDELSGVKSVDIRLDGGDFQPYDRPFSLKPGTHRIECRVSDVAGNEERTMGGPVLTGGTTAAVLVEVRQSN